MKTFTYKSLTSFLLGSAGLLLLLRLINVQQIEDPKPERIRSSSSPKASVEMKKGRWEYFFRMLRDPATNQIPPGIRQKELAFAKELQEKTKSLQKTSVTADLSWMEAGPNDVGGRTRALAVDITNPNIILAGGVSGGMWKSTDKGATWFMKSTTSQILSVTSIAQDPRNGHTNTWYYTSGEFLGSAEDQGFTHRFSGGGIYKSTDNGETWNLLHNAADTDPSNWNTNYDFISKIIISPTTGSIFTASNGLGIIKSGNGGTSFEHTLGADNDHFYSDVVVTGNGTLIAVLSSGWNQTPTNQPGVYKSTNDGQSWSNITPTTLPSEHQRSVLAIAPSNNDIIYLLTFTGQFIDEKYDDVRFHKIDISTGTSEDRSDNMPNFGQDFQDWVHTQNSYNMTLAVKPDDENFVLIGATSLFRSTNGFSTKPSDMKLDWIGGYNLEAFLYPNLHCDVHSFAFDPTNPNVMWWGHDGGLSYTLDIRSTDYETYFPWENKNNGYNVTQFYTITIPDEAGDNRIMGGTQDNGTPSFRFDGSTTTQSKDVSSGDGAYVYFGDNFPYTSTQNGLVLRIEYDQSGNPVREYPNYSNITPKDATDQLFINPFLVDPNNEDIMIYSAGNVLWRNNQLNSLPNNATFQEGITTGWTKLDNLAAPSGYVISTLTISRSNPAHRLYYGASDPSQSPGPPMVYRLDDAATATSGATDISISGAADGAYVHNIAVNPDDGNELIVILSNYNIVGIYHSTDGGQSFTAVEGNLEGNQNNPGPSIRAATILPTDQGIQYLVATSTGVYSTRQLNGSQTAWTLEGVDVMGNVVVNYLESRKSDGRIVAGTHGRGAFISEGTGAGTPVATVDIEHLNLQSEPAGSGSTSFKLRNTGTGNLIYNITVTGGFARLLQSNKSNVLSQKAGPNSKIFSKHRKKAAGFKSNLIVTQSVTSSNESPLSSPAGIEGDDKLVLDDGNENADGFIGWGDGSSFMWANEFNLSGFTFQLEAFEFYVQIEEALTNDIYAEILDHNFNTLAYGFFSLQLAQNGGWFIVTLDPVLNFNDGETFYISLETYIGGINYPAGADMNATVPNKSYYYDNVSSLENLNTISGYENGAFLIRAIGTATGGTNQDPVAVAQVSKTQAEVNESITFDASQSYDNDGQISQYFWNFGNGNTSNNQTVNHAYTQTSTYTYTLTVTDNQGATGQTSGQITVVEVSNQYVTVVPSSGTIPAGGSQTIVLTLNAQNLHAGTYVGQVNITSNDGNITIPIDMIVDVDVEETIELPSDYHLSQNFPNPFNPETTIRFQLPKDGKLTLVIYNMVGQEVIRLVDGSKKAGYYEVVWDSKDKYGKTAGTGMYILHIQAGSFTQTRKLLFIK